MLLRLLTIILVAPLAGALLLSVFIEIMFAVGVATDPQMRTMAALEAQDR